MAVLNRQPGLTWGDVGKMLVMDFFYVLKQSEKNTNADREDKGLLSRSALRAKQ